MFQSPHIRPADLNLCTNKKEEVGEERENTHFSPLCFLPFPPLFVCFSALLFKDTAISGDSGFPNS